MRSHLSLTDELRELASGYALGLREKAEQLEFADHLSGCAVCRSEVKAFLAIGAQLAQAAPSVHPSARIKAELLSKVTATRAVVRAHEGTWEKTPFPGVEIRQVFVDRISGSVTTLLRAAAGAVYPAHSHGGVEQVYVIDGDLVFNDHILETGDYEVSPARTEHSAITSKTGCLALIIHHLGDEITKNP